MVNGFRVFYGYFLINCPVTAHHPVTDLVTDPSVTVNMLYLLYNMSTVTGNRPFCKIKSPGIFFSRFFKNLKCLFFDQFYVFLKKCDFFSYRGFFLYLIGYRLPYAIIIIIIVCYKVTDR